MLGRDLPDGEFPDPGKPGMDRLVGRNVAPVKAFHVIHMFVEILDERGGLSLRIDGRPDIPGEQDAGRMIEEMEIPG